MISIIVAMSKNRVIGKDNKIPWHIPEDLKRFKQITMGHPIVMGRKTFESIGKPLPGRENIVITRNPNWKHDGVTVAHSLHEALKPSSIHHSTSTEVFIIGGAEIYKEALPLADKLYLTVIDREFEGDTFFPDFENDFQLISQDDPLISSKDKLIYRNSTFQKNH